MEKLRIDGYIGQGAGLDSIFGEGSGFSLDMLNTFLDELPATQKELTVEINSGGGSVTEGFAIHDKLVASGLEVTTEVTGICGSIATIIACSAPVERRQAHENSEYYIHNPFWQPMSPDPLESDDLAELHKDLKENEDRILDFYVKNTGAERDELKDYMKKGTKLTMKEAKKLGFIGNIIKTTAQNQTRWLIAAFVEPKSKKMEENTFTPEQKSWFEKKFNALTKKISGIKAEAPEKKNMVVDLADDTQIFVESEDGEFVGKAVFTVEDGEKTDTPAEDGEYNLKDGRVLVVKDGMVESVSEATDEDMEALKQKVSDLEAKLENATSERDTLKAEKENKEEKVKELEKEVGEIKNMVLGKEVVPTGQAFKGKSETKSKNLFDQAIDYRKSKEQN